MRNNLKLERHIETTSLRKSICQPKSRFKNRVTQYTSFRIDFSLLQVSKGFREKKLKPPNKINITPLGVL